MTPELQDSLYDAHPHNIVRLIYAKTYGSDTPEDNRYTRSAASFKTMLDKGVLVSEKEPAIYITAQTYRRPVWPGAPDEAPERRQLGFIALFRLRPLGDGDILPHEKTYSAPKEDRYRLMESCRAQFCQIYSVFSDPRASVESLLRGRIRGRAPNVNFQTASGTMWQVWVDTDAEFHARLAAALKNKQLLIADGHHRYESSLRYWKDHPGKDVPWSCVPMYFTGMEGKGLTIYPTHRLVSGLSAAEELRLEERVWATPAVRKIPVDRSDLRGTALRVLTAVQRAGRGPHFGFYSKGASAVALVNAASLRGASSALKSVPAAVRRMGVVVLHRAWLDPLLGNTDKGPALHYSVDPVETLRAVDEGRDQAAFLLAPVTPTEVFEAASRRSVLPQKTTFFYPKLMSGIVVYKWEDA